jgi:hypothetical protein
VSQASGVLYAPTVDSALWVGAVTGLAGATVGGVLSYLVSRQQIREGERSDLARRSQERRFDSYASFLTNARRFRNAIRPPRRPGSGPGLPVEEIYALHRSADAAGSLVFLVSESRGTQEACGNVMQTMGSIVGAFREADLGSDSASWDSLRWDELNEDMRRVLRDFSAAARSELGVNDAYPDSATVAIP